MLLEEFINRTGFCPTQEEYEQIETMYMKSEHDKDEFCREFVEKEMPLLFYNLRAEEVASLRKTIVDMEAAFQNEKEKLIKENDKLEEMLKIELEWRPYEFPQNCFEEDYFSLRRSGEEWDEKEAKKWISDVFGFMPEKVEILKEVDRYEINRHGRVRKVGTFKREPMYCASDWNYCRFNCGGMSYEVQNGELHFFTW